MQWKVLESEYLFKKDWLTIRKEKCELPNGAITEAYYILEYPEWVSAFALTEENKLIMVRQWRHGLGVISTELPGGVIDKNESLEDGIKRELKEETGYEFNKFEYMGKISPNPATSNNYMHMFFATGGKKVAEQQLDETEDVEVVTFSIEEVKKMIKENKIVQALHVATILYAFAKMKEINY